MPINADQCRTKFWHWFQCQSIPINADQFLSILINGYAVLLPLGMYWQFLLMFYWCLYGIDCHWSALIAIDLNWEESEMIRIERPWVLSTLIVLGIDRGSPVINRLLSLLKKLKVQNLHSQDGSPQYNSQVQCTHVEDKCTPLIHFHVKGSCRSVIVHSLYFLYGVYVNY